MIFVVQFFCCRKCALTTLASQRFFLVFEMFKNIDFQGSSHFSISKKNIVRQKSQQNRSLTKHIKFDCGGGDFQGVGINLMQLFFSGVPFLKHIQNKLYDV